MFLKKISVNTHFASNKWFPFRSGLRRQLFSLFVSTTRSTKNYRTEGVVRGVTSKHWPKKNCLPHSTAVVTYGSAFGLNQRTIVRTLSARNLSAFPPIIKYQSFWTANKRIVKIVFRITARLWNSTEVVKKKIHSQVW